MEVEVILLLEYPNLVSELENANEKSYIIGNKKYTKKWKCASLRKRTLYCLQSTTAKKQNICKTKQKTEEKYVTKSLN